MEKWRGKTAIVTGASAGIGAQIVRDLAKAGINVIALARRFERLDALKKELANLVKVTGKVTTLACDVSNQDSVEMTFSLIEQTLGPIHILVNNAGVARNVNILDEGDDEEALEKIEEVIQTNFTGLVHCTRKAFHLMDKSGDYGIIINIGSVVGHIIPLMDLSHNVYPGTKFAVRATTEVIRQELVKRNNNKIRVSEISPGVVDTKFIEASGFNPTSAALPERPSLRASDVSQAVQFLLMTDYSVNLTEIVIKPTGEPF